LTVAHRIDPRHLGRLDSPLRKLLLPPAPLLARLGLREGDVLLDVGAGSGHFSFPAAELVGEKGRVHAIDIEPKAIELLSEKRDRRGAANVDIHLSSDSALGVPEATGSFALLFTVLHEAEDKKGLLLLIRRALSRGGRIAIVEFRKAFVPGPPPSERISEDEMRGLLEASGFSGIRSEKLNFALYASFATA